MSSFSSSLSTLAQKRLSAVYDNAKETRLNLARCSLFDHHLALINWSRLTHVRQLDLSGNNLTSLPPQMVENLVFIEELSLYKV
jgi:Leucine-rich repeat (LRR) protein